MGNLCLCDAEDCRFDHTSEELEEVQSATKRVDLSKIIMLQATWRGYSTRKRLYFTNSQSKPDEEQINEGIGEIALKLTESLLKKYKGDLSGKNRHGKGTQHWIDGCKYEGEWVTNLPCGFGVYSDSAGQTYTGWFHEGVPKGFGGLISKENNSYNGYWVNGQASGKGTQVIYNGSSFKGDFAKGLRNGYGELFLANKDCYKGFFLNGVMNGFGVYKWKDGKVYMGNWDKGKKKGFGCILYINKRKFEGFFEDDRRHGFGVVTLPDGTEKQGVWEHGRYKNLPNILLTN